MLTDSMTSWRQGTTPAPFFTDYEHLKHKSTRGYRASPDRVLLFQTLYTGDLAHDPE